MKLQEQKKWIVTIRTTIKINKIKKKFLFYTFRLLHHGEDYTTKKLSFY